jgi:hypothetical protein
MVKISRRSLLVGGGGLAVLAAGALYTGRSAYAAENTIVQFVRSRVPTLNMSDADLQSFAKDALARNDLAPLRLRLMLFFMDNPLALRLAPAGIAFSQGREERSIVTNILMSSNFFDKARGDAPSTYLGWLDPYSRPCTNPLASFDA